MMLTVKSSSTYLVPEIKRFIPANCPADVTFVILMKTASYRVNPFKQAVMPKVNETTRYPKAIGKPAFNSIHYKSV